MFYHSGMHVPLLFTKGFAFSDSKLLILCVAGVVIRLLTKEIVCKRRLCPMSKHRTEPNFTSKGDFNGS